MDPKRPTDDSAQKKASNTDPVNDLPERDRKNTENESDESDVKGGALRRKALE